jgi:hypothetical protein
MTDFPSKTLTPQSLTTTFAGGNGNYGTMFEIQATKRLIVTAFDIHTDSMSSTPLLVYFRRGTYIGFESSSVGWEQIVNTMIQGQGFGNPTSIPRNSFSAITLEAGGTCSFYIETVETRYTDYVAGTVLPSDANLRFLSSVGKRHNFSNTFLNRLWNGVIYYLA